SCACAGSSSTRRIAELSTGTAVGVGSAKSTGIAKGSSTTVGAVPRGFDEGSTCGAPCGRCGLRGAPAGVAKGVELLARVDVGERAEHDDDAVADCAHLRGRVLDERAAVELRELLGAAEAAALARGEDDAARQAPTSWMRPPARPSRPPSRPWRTATTSARI